MDIAPWKDIDRAAIRSMILDFLKAGAERGGDLVPCSENVDALWRLGRQLADAGDPCLVGIVGGEPVAYVQWGGVNTAPFVSRFKTCHTFGSFTQHRHRHHGIAGALRSEALTMARALGYQRIIGPVAFQNQRGMAEFVAQGAWPTHAQWELHV